MVFSFFNGKVVFNIVDKDDFVVVVWYNDIGFVVDIIRFIFDFVVVLVEFM